MPEATSDSKPKGVAGRARAVLAAVWPWAASAAAIALAVALWSAATGEPASPRKAIDDLRRAARQREVGRMIETLADVSAARVMLRDTTDGASDAASVTLTMKPGRHLGPETAAAVAGLVASATPGVDAADVVVVDAARPAETHRLAPDADVAHDGAALLRLRAQVERALADKVRGFFAGMQIESVVVVSAVLDFDTVKERLLDVDPQGRGEFVVREERAVGPAAGAAMAPDERSAVAGVNRSAELPSAAARAGRDGEYRKTESIVSHVTREIVRSGKGLAEVSAGVVLFDRLVQGSDGAWQYDRSVKDNLDGYRSLVARAVGASDARNVEIEYLPSPWASPPVAASEPAGGTAYGAVAALVVGATLAVFGLAALRRRRAAVARAEPLCASEPADAPQVSAAEALRREAARIVGEDIDRAVAVLGQWVARET